MNALPKQHLHEVHVFKSQSLDVFNGCETVY